MFDWAMVIQYLCAAAGAAACVRLLDSVDKKRGASGCGYRRRRGYKQQCRSREQ